LDFSVEHLVSGNQLQSHSLRLNYYSDKDLRIEPPDKIWCKVLKVLNPRVDEGVFKLLEEWHGLDKIEATWSYSR
jgi:hypothetical protein